VSRLAVRLELVAGAEAAHDARLGVRRVLGEWHLPHPVVEDVTLAVSELVTNAVLHAHTSSTLDLELSQTGDWLRLSVSDGSTNPPLARIAGGTDEGGRGLAILAALCDRWGIEAYGGGKRVWCEVDLARCPGYVGSTSR
jgi:anti-sigma regulatory factor (Ser/Thr protein kinase)